MAISNLARAAIKAISFTDIDLTNMYWLERIWMNVRGFDFARPFYQTWDHKVKLNDREIPVRMFFPSTVKQDLQNKQKLPLLIFFHGGGWVTGNIDTYTRCCAYLANRTGHMVLSVDYRLAPEHKFPAAPEDCYAVTREVFIHCEDVCNISAESITLIGDSAGANLSAAVSIMARDRGEFAPARQILLYPATYYEHTPSSPYRSVVENGTDYLLTSRHIDDYMKLYASSKEDFSNPYFAPLLSQDLSAQPRTLVITAQFDPLRDEGEAYGNRLGAAGNYAEVHRIPDTLHGFFTLPPKYSELQLAYQYILWFLDDVPGAQPEVSDQ